MNSVHPESVEGWWLWASTGSARTGGGQIRKLFTDYSLGITFLASHYVKQQATLDVAQSLQRTDVFCPRTFLALSNSKFNLLTFSQSLETVANDLTEMGKLSFSVKIRSQQLQVAACCPTHPQPNVEQNITV
ncbi:hypothetical protein GZ78_09645 [Endozoicomonas numazuensis]|uniref:Uncharacterized protein n=1 Tax=Endozoicomonas numazuensis TaxID=1137799 RepID=A0A081NHH0_9GAMM|nr:hypothetical protein GZ78_09645 [Endozoicomonas numazuensis]